MNHQRIDARSNAHAGRAFEEAAATWLEGQGIPVEFDFSVDIGVEQRKKRHRFDLGCVNPPTLVECKSHRWTTGSNVPSAKMGFWNQAMYYFACAPGGYRKILCVLRDLRGGSGETLADYYVRTYGHLVPADVEIWELDEGAGAAREVVAGADGPRLDRVSRANGVMSGPAVAAAMTSIRTLIADLATDAAGEAIPKPQAKAPFLIKGLGTRRGEPALIYQIPSHTGNRPYEKGITFSEFERAVVELDESGSFSRSWFGRNLPGCAKEGACNFTSLGGCLELLRLARYQEPAHYVAT